MITVRCDDVSILTPQEFRIFKRYGEGLGTTDIANEVSLSVKTVSTYLHRITEKFGCQNVYHLRVMAILKYGRYEVDPFIALKVPEGWTKGEDLVKINTSSLLKPGLIRAVDTEKYQSSGRKGVKVIKFDSFEERDLWIQWWRRKENEEAA